MYKVSDIMVYSEKQPGQIYDIIFTIAKCVSVSQIKWWNKKKNR